MSQDFSRWFGGPLQVDPAIAIRTDDIEIPSFTGPSPKTQLVIEWVGPKSITAQSFQAILDPRWHEALGRPELWVMASADVVWRMPIPSDASYDSVACAWNFEGHGGELSPTSATHLLNALTQFVEPLGRRAMPMPVPQDVPEAIREMKQIQENLDVGIELGIVPNRGEISEADVWKAAVALGFDLGPDQVFDLRTSTYPLPLLTIASWDEPFRFSLDAVQRGKSHSAIGIGFSIPRSPDPQRVFPKMMHAAQQLALKLDAVLLDDQERPMTATAEGRMRKDVLLAAQTLAKFGVKPGSAAALRLFPEMA
jgi:hypothetical protein